MSEFKLRAEYEPAGDQKAAIGELTKGIMNGDKFQTLLGVTGSGKTFTMANVIRNVDRPTLIISHNKTLAAQLYGEFKQFFPENAVEYFISYYDYYQPEAYVVRSDTYIEKDFSINEEIEKLRLRATSALLERRDVILVASVSCIYGIGSPAEYVDMLLIMDQGQEADRDEILKKLIEMQYDRNDVGFKRGTFRVRGDVIDIYPAYEEYYVRVEMFGDEIEALSVLDPVTNRVLDRRKKIILYPASHFVTRRTTLDRAVGDIKKELADQLAFLRDHNRLLEAQRLEQRTVYDLEMMQELGYCSGIENYSRHIAGRLAGERPACLIDFFPEDYLMFIDESHVTIPQVRGMYEGDRSRKKTLVEHGFRLPSALDNRPLQFDEFESMLNQVIFVSATPADFELERSRGVVVEQVIRPTGLLDPEVEVRPVKGQIDDLIAEIRDRTGKNERILVLTLTKRMSEDLTDYLKDLNISVKYLHSEIDALARVDILRDLRLGNFDVLVGVNLLREGLDLPEVSLVAILDADKEGFLRSSRSLMQTAGRAARNLNGRVIFYADKITDSMKNVIDETKRRRLLQTKFNEDNQIVPRTVSKSKDSVLKGTAIADQLEYRNARRRKPVVAEQIGDYVAPAHLDGLIKQLKSEMTEAVKNLEFEKAAEIRDELYRLEVKKG